MIFKIFQNSPVVYALSSLADGNMHLGFADYNKNRNKFFQTKNILGKKIIAAGLAHGIKVWPVNQTDDAGIIPEADALVTGDENTILTITVADCFPIYFYNTKINKIALAHSGWRGTVGNIAVQVIEAMGGNPEDFLVGIGPGIQSCHFEIKEDIVDKFKIYPKAIVYRENKIFIDLPSIIRQQLTDAGVKSIENFGQCTYCLKEKYFSFRRDKPKKVEAMLAYIAIAKTA